MKERVKRREKREDVLSIQNNCKTKTKTKTKTTVFCQNKQTKKKNTAIHTLSPSSQNA
jgi:hypothetical protein